MHNTALVQGFANFLEEGQELRSIPVIVARPQLQAGVDYNGPIILFRNIKNLPFEPGILLGGRLEGFLLHASTSIHSPSWRSMNAWDGPG